MPDQNGKKDALPSLKAVVLLIIGTTVVVSGVWGFFFVRSMDLKNGEITLLEKRNDDLREFGTVPEAVKSLTDRLIPLTLAFPMDPFNGCISVGTAAKSTTEISKLISKAEEFRRGKKFDLAAAQLDEIDELYPGFLGTPYFRFLIEKDKANAKEALAFAEQAIRNLPDDTRVLPAYSFAVAAHIQDGERKQVEDLCLAIIRLEPENKEVREFFKQYFGYEPSVPKE